MDDREVNRGSSSRVFDGNPGASISKNLEDILVFRNYSPQTQFFEGHYIHNKSKAGSINPLIEDKLSLISDSDYRIDPSNLDPKKVDWDLKKRLRKRLDILEVETEKSIKKHIKDGRSKR